jgi:hypothetical protein
VKKYKSAVVIDVACPLCGAVYGVGLDDETDSHSGLLICNASKNPKFTHKSPLEGGTFSYIWCGARIAYEVGRSYTYAGATRLEKQPSRFKRYIIKKPLDTLK